MERHIYDQIYEGSNWIAKSSWLYCGVVLLLLVADHFLPASPTKSQTHTHTDKHTGWQACFLAGTSLIRPVVVWENNFNLAKLNAACDRQNVERVRRKTTEDGDGDGDGA